MTSKRLQVPPLVKAHKLALVVTYPLAKERPMRLTALLSPKTVEPPSICE